MNKHQPVVLARREGLALHIAQSTGKGYKAACGRVLEGADVEVPMPRFPRSRRHVEAFWDRCWQLEVVCGSCARVKEQ